MSASYKEEPFLSYSLGFGGAACLSKKMNRSILHDLYSLMQSKENGITILSVTEEKRWKNTALSAIDTGSSRSHKNTSLAPNWATMGLVHYHKSCLENDHQKSQITGKEMFRILSTTNLLQFQYVQTPTSKVLISQTSFIIFKIKWMYCNILLKVHHH